LWFIGAFVVALLLVLLFPATMLGLRLWGAYTIAVGLLSFRNFWCETRKKAFSRILKKES